MAGCRVLVAWSHALFYGSVRLLLQHPDIEIVGVNAETETVWREVNTLRPDTIIIERGGEDDLPLLGIRILGESDLWNPRIIHTGMHDNVAHVCYCEQHTLDHAEDLLHLVLNE